MSCKLHNDHEEMEINLQCLALRRNEKCLRLVMSRMSQGKWTEVRKTRSDCYCPGSL